MTRGSGWGMGVGLPSDDVLFTVVLRNGRCVVGEPIPRLFLERTVLPDLLSGAPGGRSRILMYGFPLHVPRLWVVWKFAHQHRDEFEAQIIAQVRAGPQRVA